MSRAPFEEPEMSSDPIWASEPFRIFFPLGIVAAVFGLLLWPLHYAGWWPVYPAIQHPRILIFGFGAAFVFGFLGTAWPRFVEAETLRIWELVVLGLLWVFGQIAYAKVAISGGDLFSGSACLWFLIALGRRLFGEGRDEPPAGFALAYLAVSSATVVLFSWGLGWNKQSPEIENLHRLIAYQGFLLLPLLGVGTFLFPKFFQRPRFSPKPVSATRRAIVVWVSAVLILGSFGVEAFGSIRWGNVIRIVAILLWGLGAVPMLFHGKAPGTRAWALRFGLCLILIAYLCRVIWPLEIFAFEHILFLGGFCQLMLLVADRVATGHGENEPPLPRSLRWRWVVWLLVLTAATRAAADLVPSTRISHHIYAAIMLTIVFVIWWTDNGRRLRQVADEED